MNTTQEIYGLGWSSQPVQTPSGLEIDSVDAPSFMGTPEEVQEEFTRVCHINNSNDWRVVLFENASPIATGSHDVAQALQGLTSDDDAERVYDSDGVYVGAYGDYTSDEVIERRLEESVNWDDFSQVTQRETLESLDDTSDEGLKRYAEETAQQFNAMFRPAVPYSDEEIARYARVIYAELVDARSEKEMEASVPESEA